MVTMTRSRSAKQVAKDVMEVDEACAATSSSIVPDSLVLDSSSFKTVQPVAPSSDSDTTMLDQLTSIHSRKGVKKDSTLGSETVAQRPRRTLKLIMGVSKRVTVSDANVVVEAEKLSTTTVIAEGPPSPQQVTPARGRKRGSSTQDALPTPPKRGRKSAEDADEDFKMAKTKTIVSTTRSLRVRNAKGTVTGATEIAAIARKAKENARHTFITLKVPGLTERYKEWKLRPERRLNKTGFRFGRNQLPFWCSPSRYELREVVKILEVERTVLTKPTAQNGTASRPFHAARGLTVDSLVRVILSQSLSNEVALDMQQALIYNYPYEVDGKVYEGTKPNYHEIREQSVSKLLKILTGAGLQGVKTIPIKSCLDIIYEKNLSLLDPGEVVYSGQEPGAKDFVPGLLSMDFIWDAYRQGGKQAAFNALTSLPQVGVKTAACLMSFNMGIPVFAVDTHVAAMSKLLG
ncbi:hypothetical protein PV04_01714 [Phialophora macrospora]|uniref:HhH-GPD domain-containing protein n=1 Tax=Phialophora macrospora TaxID=1851006 RepID=A0A0D2D7R4_9EURO|nr:hypothetical protein PV04_01714 [Phialophora macrospora]